MAEGSGFAAGVRLRPSLTLSCTSISLTLGSRVPSALSVRRKMGRVLTVCVHPFSAGVQEVRWDLQPSSDAKLPSPKDAHATCVTMALGSS